MKCRDSKNHASRQRDITSINTASRDTHGKVKKKSTREMAGGSGSTVPMEHTTSEPESKATPGREKIEQDYGVLCI
jgi:hypothetical protein